MSASTSQQPTRAPKLSVTDLPMGPGAGRIPPSEEVHPKNWYQSPADVTSPGGGVNSIAHGLGRVPNLVILVVVDNNNAAFTVVYGAHTSTNIVCNVTAAAKFRAYAI